MLLCTGEDRHLTVALDADRHLRTDKIEALRDDMAGQEADAGQAHFRLRRARDDRAFLVAHGNIEQAQRGLPLFVALDLCATDGDGVVVPKIFLHRRFQPWRRKVDFDRTGIEPPPQAADCDEADRQQRRRTPQHARDPTTVQHAHQPMPPPVPTGPQRHAQQRRMRRTGVPSFVLVRAVRHACCGPLPGGIVARAGRTPSTASPAGPPSSGRLRPSGANGISDIDGPKATKGRHMAEEPEVGESAPNFTLPRDGGGTVSLKDFKSAASSSSTSIPRPIHRAAPRRPSRSPPCARASQRQTRPFSAYPPIPS